jgi:hypothetical protein
MIALLAPPGDGTFLEVVAIVRDKDSRFLQGERELFFVRPAQVACGKSGQAIDAVRCQQRCEKHVHVFVQVDAQRSRSGRHCTFPVAGSNCLPVQLSGMRLAAINASISCR